MSRAAFDLDMRVGLVPVAAIHSQTPYRVLVARYRASPHYTQAMFMGGGLAHADTMLKSTDGERYHITEEVDADPGSFKGLECRWNDVPHPEGEVVALLILGLAPDPQARADVYQHVLDDIHAVYGDVTPHNPVTREQLQISLSPAKLSVEAGARTVGMGRFKKFRYQSRQLLVSLLGRWLFRNGSTFAGVNWGQYQRELVANTDYRKIDDMLRFILPSNAVRREQLTQRFETRRLNNELVYGIHVGKTAVMACLVFNYVGAHVHFVDGSNGGYTAAATMLKAQLKAVREAEATR
jgi:hypothetical protein